MQIQLLGNIPDMPWDACDDDGVASLKDIPPIPFILYAYKLDILHIYGIYGVYIHKCTSGRSQYINTERTDKYGQEFWRKYVTHLLV